MTTQRRLVDEARIAQPLRIEQRRAMHDRLDRRHEDERGEIGIADRELVSARGEQARDHAMADLVELAQLREPADARHLLGQHAMQLGIDGVRADRQLDHGARGLRDRQRRDARRARRGSPRSCPRCGARSARRPAPPCSGSTGRASRSTRPPRVATAFVVRPSKPCLTRTRAVASRIVSTVALLRCLARAFPRRGPDLALHRELLRAVGNASRQCERSLAF